MYSYGTLLVLTVPNIILFTSLGVGAVGLLTNVLSVLALADSSTLFVDTEEVLI